MLPHCHHVSNESSDPLFTQIEPSLGPHVPLSESMSPLAGQQDPLPHDAHASLSRCAYATSQPAEETLDMYASDTYSWSPTISSDSAYNFNHLLDDCDNATLCSPASDFDFGLADEAYGSSLDMTFISNNVPEAHTLETNFFDIYAPWSTLSPRHTSSSSCYPHPWDSPVSTLDSTYGEGSSFWTSPNLLDSDQQNLPGFFRNSVSPRTTDIQLVHDQKPGFWACNEAIPESQIEPISLVQPSEIHEMTQAWNIESEDYLNSIQTPSAPSSSPIKGTNTDLRSVCSICHRKFSHLADLSRHTRTQHGEAGKGYRCAFAGCSKVHKVWSRLDSFKKHVKKQHQIEDDADVNNLVSKSATGEHGLPIAMTSLYRVHAGSSASRVCHSVSL